MAIETKYNLGDVVYFKARADGETKQGEIVLVSATRGDPIFSCNEEWYVINSDGKYYSIFDEGVLGLVKDSV